MIKWGDLRGPFVPSILGMVLLAAGAADGHDLAVSARDADWPLLIRADLELLGGFWLLSGRFAVGVRIVAIAAWGGILACDMAGAMAGAPSRPLFGRVAAGPGWLLSGDVLIAAGLLAWRTAPRAGARSGTPPGRLAIGLVLAFAAGIAVDRSQVGQFPIVATVRAGRTHSGLDHLVYLPDGYYRSLRRWPMILTLHGRGESGDDLGLVRRQGLPRLIEQGDRLPFVVVAPQSPDWHWSVEALEVLLDEALRRYRVDADRVYLAGNSMGGNGAWELAARRPERFAAIVPVCGRGNPGWAARLRDVPTWAFHGSDDRIVPPEESRRMVAALSEAGGDARLALYPGVGHDAWTPAFGDPDLYRWLLRHRRRPDARQSSPDRSGAREGQAPFLGR